jgi:hypothetical protein
MKVMQSNKFNIPVFLFIIVSFLGVSCKKSFFTDVNVNINAPDEGSIVPNVLLSSVEGTLGYTQGGDFSRYTSLLTQQTTSKSRQAGAYYQYIFTSVDFDSPWGNMYTSVMENNKTLMQIADSKGNNRYSGISRVLMAYTLQMGVDMWGSLPYSDAFQGATKLQSKFDTDKDLYDTINNMLTLAITQLSSSSPGARLPGSEDIIYGGSAAKWIKFAHAIKARLYIHQSKGVPAMANSALAEIAQSFTSNADNARYIFGSTETSANPWYQFNEQRGDISFTDSWMVKKMVAANDPRYLIYSDTSFKDVNVVGMGSYYGSVNSPVEFITYDELLFMKAEATLTATGDVTTAQLAYDSAIQKNMQKLGVSPANIASYLAANGVLPVTAAAAIAQVSAQEYMALYLNPEAFTLWRRTNSPALTPITGSSVPRRFLYPQTEYSYNSANVPASATLFAPKVFWDK